MKNKIKLITGNGNKNDFREAIRMMKEQMHDQLEFYKLTAKLHRAKYLALIDEGFTPAEALELSKIL